VRPALAPASSANRLDVEAPDSGPVGVWFAGRTNEVDAVGGEAHGCPHGRAELSRIGLESSQVEDNHPCKLLT
jgi:hypothetical protein